MIITDKKDAAVRSAQRVANETDKLVRIYNMIDGTFAVVRDGEERPVGAKWSGNFTPVGPACCPNPLCDGQVLVSGSF